MRKSKARCQTIHAQRRALQRFDVFLTEQDMSDIVGSITAGKAKHIRKQSNRISVFEVEVLDQTMFVVYDKSRKTIVTFLTERMARA